MTWKQTIRGLCPDANFAPPASDDQLSAIEKELGVALPDDLRLLLTECNGVEGEYGLGLVWSAERILTDNRMFRNNIDFRELYMPFNHLLFFADASNGDQFAYPIHGSDVRRPDVFAWNHEDDSRQWVAPSLEKYLEWWLSGRLVL